MKKFYDFYPIPRSRIATFDVFSVGKQKHHVSALLELDVTEGRRKLKVLKQSGLSVSFNAWIIKVISNTIEQHPEAAAFVYNKKKLISFNDINISLLIEKEVEGKRIPLPLVLHKTNEKSIEEISLEIRTAKNQILHGDERLLKQKNNISESIYCHLPGFLRRLFWNFMLSHPRMAFKNMGNVAITSVGTLGNVQGWFIHASVHPLSLGLASVIKKPRVVNNAIEIRDILNITLLFDHDVLDGAPMARFVRDLNRDIEMGWGL
ncbi:MAG: 2-oxo acid dehydrogenase subunit E2 [Bacteroidales bacterium]|jgi:pyruvate/2-oxoglutarate dehydrogenase complex dihydrolipoamide acyltransferase (E2) component|nr:2-oxo acid dehydrogenase subunit E2 [Bacteroidales bacterium]